MAKTDERYGLDNSPIPPLYKDGRVAAKPGEGLRKIRHEKPTVREDPATARKEHAAQAARGKQIEGRKNHRDTESVRKLQAFLNNRGYHVAVDGQWGPQTESAAKFFRENHHKGDSGASKWNATSDGVRAGKPAGNVNRTMATGSDGGKTDTTSNPFASLINQIMGGITSGDPSSGNVDDLARSMTDEQFAGPIAELKRQIEDQTTKGSQNQADLQTWFNGVLGMNKDNNAADKQAYADISGDSSDLMAKVAGSLDDPAAKDEFAKAAGFNDTLLKGLGANAGEYNRNMDLAFKLMGKDSMKRQANEDDTALKDVKGQLLDLITQRGNALTTNAQGVTDNLLQRKSARINQLATLMMLPGQLEGQGWDNLLKQANIDYTLGGKGAGLKRPSAGDYSRAYSDAWKGLQTDEFDADGNKTGRKVPLQFQSPNDLVRAVNSSYTGSGLHSNDPQALASRNAVLKRFGIKNISPQWKF